MPINKSEYLQGIRLEYYPEPEFDSLSLGDFPDNVLVAGKVKSRFSNYGVFFRDFGLLTPEEERLYFRKYNFLKHQLVKKIDNFEDYNDTLKEIFRTRDFLVNKNMRLLIYNLRWRLPVFRINEHELASDAFLVLLRCVEYFDYRTGNKFSSLFIFSIQRRFRSTIERILHKGDQRKEQYVDFNTLEHSKNAPKSLMSPWVSFKESERIELNKKRVVDFILTSVKTKNDREHDIVMSYFGINKEHKNLVQLGEKYKVSRERIRQIKDRYLKRALSIVVNDNPFED